MLVLLLLAAELKMEIDNLDVKDDLKTRGLKETVYMK